MTTQAFACYNKNINIRKQSSSGGIYYLLAEEIIRKGGVVYGACYEGLEVRHFRITDEEGILASCGSKYVASDLGNTFTNIHRDLDEKRIVLFVGTPCQCAGLLSFERKNRKNLYCVDTVCLGVPGKRVWHSYLDALRARGYDVTSVNMRDKSGGWKQYSWRLKCIDGKEIVQTHHDNTYTKGFQTGLYLRPSCYNCKFKGVERNTDITLGDYWGVWNIQPAMYDDMGTSLVMVHSDKGMELFQKISDRIVSAEASLKNVAIGNPYMIRSVRCPTFRERFYERIKLGEDFISVVEMLTKLSPAQRVKRKTKYVLVQLKNLFKRKK